MMVPGPETVIAAMRRKNYTVFDGGRLDLNIFGLRRDEARAGAFDDLIGLFHRQEPGRGAWLYLVFGATTDPGRHWLERGQAGLGGTAILKAGQYRGAYCIRKHRGVYEALCQDLAPVTVIRDGNRDDRLDFGGIEETGYFGINIHRADPAGEAAEVGRYSAGCQVIRDPADFDVFMRICRQAAGRWGNRFTYTLLNERDLAA